MTSRPRFAANILMAVILNASMFPSGARGVYERSPKLTGEQVAEARERIDAAVPKARVARDLGVSRQTLYTALSGGGVYA